MNILWICNQNTGNRPYLYCKYINQYTRHKAKLIQCQTTFLNYPTDSTIMAETKSTRPQVIARRQAIKEAASATQSAISQKMRSGDIEVDISGTVLYNGEQITFEEVLTMSNNNKDRAVRFWSLRVPADKVRKLDEPATKVYEFDENGKLIK